jgi:hypothetical protein
MSLFLPVRWSLLPVAGLKRSARPKLQEAAIFEAHNRQIGRHECDRSCRSTTFLAPECGPRLAFFLGDTDGSEFRL